MGNLSKEYDAFHSTLCIREGGNRMPASKHAEHLESGVLHIYVAAIQLTVLAQQEPDVIRNSQSC